MRYYPYLSIPENAKRNNCSEAAVRKYIRVNGIDRRFERKATIVNEIRKVIRKDSSLTVSEIAKATHHSVNTIKTYYPFATKEIPLSKSDTEKVSKTDIRQLNNYYVAHPSVTQDILKAVQFNREILEPFCGCGTMAEVIKNNGYSVMAYDIVDRGYGNVGDFFMVDFPNGQYDIISNPPYNSNLNAIIKRCIKLCKSKVALLMPLNYLSGVQRLEQVFKDYPPKCIYVYSNNIKVGREGNYDEVVGYKITYAWYIWEKGFDGEPTLRWIVNQP